ncbi:MAG: efflux RND transporter periplasmic adaptor subunit [Deltaproteobacteria bacterium]|nr:efflux RND transporter periplasmic adaptor subunit [Deltaproteobacteria bacterium]MBW2416905.1 efflux RND transporter periplasmic adaptor subunit [Deltaproteobacteria bacterium]
MSSGKHSALPITAALFTALLCAAVLQGCGGKAPPEVQVAAVQRDSLEIEVSTNGKIEPIDELDLRAHLDGRVVEIPEPGTVVAQGEVVLRIDDAPVSASLAAARSERLASLESLRAAKAERKLVRGRHAIDRDLYEKGGLTAQGWAESQAALAKARKRVEFLEEEVPLRVDSLDQRIEILARQKEAATVLAPFAGTIYRREVKKGAMVRAGDPVLRMADLEHLRVRANVDQVDLGRVRPGQQLRISSNAYPGRSWEATISELVPHVVMKESRLVSESLASIEPPTQGLVPGMTVDVDILVDSSAAALQVPADAIFMADGKPFAYRVDSNRVRRAPITLGRSSIESVEILSGLEEGDRIVVGAAEELADGVRVAVRNPAVGGG